MEPVRIRPYRKRDRSACLTVLRRNVPEHFTQAEERSFADFLDDLPGPYFVVDDADGSVVACGGIAAEDDPGVATLCWGIVSAGRQRAGIGTALLEHRLRAFLPSHPEVVRVRIDTSQKVQGFFAKHGFRVIEVRIDGHGPGIDSVKMERAL